MRGSRLRAGLAALALLAMPAMADWKQDYARGLEAAKKGNWEDVDRYMQGALAGNAEPAERLRLYGQRFEVYAPQHYAGMAALRLGDINQAIGQAHPCSWSFHCLNSGETLLAFGYGKINTT